MSPNEGTTVVEPETGTASFVAITVGEQWFGIPVEAVRDVLGPQQLTQVPLAPSDVAGLLNLRGRIVTAIDVRRRLGVPGRRIDEPQMSVVVDDGNELYSLIVDTVSEVLTLPLPEIECNPSTIDPVWKAVSRGVFRLEERLLLVLDVHRLLDISASSAA